MLLVKSESPFLHLYLCQVLVLNDYRERQRLMGCECIAETEKPRDQSSLLTPLLKTVGWTGGWSHGLRTIAVSNEGTCCLQGQGKGEPEREPLQRHQPAQTPCPVLFVSWHPWG